MVFFMIETKLDGKSRDIVADNISKLKEIFPEIMTEDGIDFDKLKSILGENIDSSNERYNFTWPGKIDADNESRKRSSGTLRPYKDESKNWDTTKNLYIEGDNLEVLKLLQSSYYNKIKCIYIDPPYNTGKDFVYHDNFATTATENDLAEGNTDELGNRYRRNTDSNGRFHPEWSRF